MTNSGDEYECEIGTSGMTETSVERCVYVYQSGRVCGALQEATEHDPQGRAERWHVFKYSSAAPVVSSADVPIGAEGSE